MDSPMTLESANMDFPDNSRKTKNWITKARKKGYYREGERAQGAIYWPGYSIKKKTRA